MLGPRIYFIHRAFYQVRKIIRIILVDDNKFQTTNQAISVNLNKNLFIKNFLPAINLVMDRSRGVPDGTESDPSSTNASSTITSNTVPNVNNPLTNWKPNDQFLQNLISMGISHSVARKALRYTNNESVEAAVEWVFSNGDDSELESLEAELQLQEEKIDTVNQPSQSGTTGFAQATNSCDDLCKMVFVVNSNLSMGVGKIAAQVAHAALGLHRLLLQHQSKFGESMLSWNEYGETKIVLKGKDTQHLMELEQKAISLDIPCYMVHDAGKTQVVSGSITVLGMFGNNKLIDQVTGHLNLY